MEEGELHNNIVTKHPMFGTRGSLTLDIAIAPYRIIPFSLFSIFNSTGIHADKDNGVAPSPYFFVHLYHWLLYRIIHCSLFVLLISRPLLRSTGAYTARKNFKVSL